VAWIEHEWSGTGLRHLHFERREASLRDEVVNPIWTPLYTTPQPQQAEKQEPVTQDVQEKCRIEVVPAKGGLLPTPQPQREWVGLTEEEIMEMLDYGKYGHVPQYARNFVDAIEAKLKENNT
jgi:hypothetical protein